MKKSFTLIELAVAIGIIVLLTAGSVVGISSARSRRQVKTTAENLRAYLMEARAQAMTSPDTSAGVTKIKFKIKISPNEVNLWEVKVSPAVKISDFTITKGVEIANLTNMTCEPVNNPTECYFSFIADNASTLGQLTDLKPASSDTATIEVSNKSNKYELKIYRQTGLVEIKQISP